MMREINKFKYYGVNNEIISVIGLQMILIKNNNEKEQ